MCVLVDTRVLKYSDAKKLVGPTVAIINFIMDGGR